MLFYPANLTVCDQNKLVQYNCTGLDANGNPNWDASNAVTIPIPEFSAVCRMSYDSDNDIMYMAGDFPKKSDGGDEYGSFIHVKRFDNWSKGGRKSSFTATVPYNDSQYTAETSWGGGMATSFATAGDYIFILYGYGHIRILNKADGSLVGTLKQNVNGWTGSGGQVDAHFGLTAFKRSNGQYILLFENAAWANIMIQRWCPSGDCPETLTSIVNSEEGMKDYTLFPDPFTNELKTSQQVDEISIFNIHGVLLHKERFTHSINTSNLANGIYFVRLQKNGYSKVVKCVK